MTRIIALVNQKGGVGKTTSTINIAAGLSRLNRRALVIDLDPQANLTYSLGIAAHELEATVYEVLKGERLAKDTLHQAEGFDVIPASIELSGAELELSGIAGRELLLREALAPIMADYDYILLDSPPSLGILTLNGLTTAKEIFIALQTEFLAMQGMSKLLQTIEIVKRRLNQELNITGIIGTLYDNRRTLNREVIEKIREYFNDKLFNTLIRDNVALAEAPSFGLDIFSYKKDSNGAKDYLALCHEIISQEEAKA